MCVFVCTEVLYGGSVSVLCLVTSSLLGWTNRNGNGTEFSIDDTTLRLELSNVNRSSEGLYSCVFQRSSSSESESRQSACVIVIGMFLYVRIIYTLYIFI